MSVLLKSWIATQKWVVKTMRMTMGGREGQWWILGEANEAVASGPSLKIAHTVSIGCKCFLEVILKSGQKMESIEVDSR